MNQYNKEPNMKSTKFFIRILAVFFTLVNPASTSANPGCIKNTSIAASNIQTVFSPKASSPIVSGVSASVSAGAAVISVVVSTTVVTVSAATASCASVPVAKQHNINIVVAIHSFTKLWLLYFVSIMNYLIKCLLLVIL